MFLKSHFRISCFVWIISLNIKNAQHCHVLYFMIQITHCLISYYHTYLMNTFSPRVYILCTLHHLKENKQDLKVILLKDKMHTLANFG